jgi:hypothetical protein
MARLEKIPRARQLIAEVMQHTGVDAPAKLKLGQALTLMRRKPAAHRGEAEPEEITPEIKAEVLRLARTTRLTYHQIADAVGLRNIGRISEIVNGLR